MGKINRKRKRQDENQKNIPDESIPPAPYVIVVHGPPKVGKSLLIKSLVQHYTYHELTDDDTRRPIRIAVKSGEQYRRIQFVECPNNVNGMIDAAKYADAVIFVIDVSYGFEMETLEFVSLLKVHGMPKVIGVFTHLDCFLNKDVKIEKMRTARFEKLFRNEIHEEAHIFCLSAPDEDKKIYQVLDVSKLASFILGMEFHPISWRAAHPYVLVDRFEDVTATESSHMAAACERDIIFHGYLRGCDIKNKGTKVHIAGIGDFPLAGTGIAEHRLVPHINDLKIDDETHTKKEILRVGSYLKFKICDVPSEIVKNRDPWQPILVGGISDREQKVGLVSSVFLFQARFERHSLHIKSLRTNDDIIVSVGWRRYLTKLIYDPKDLSLDSTPEDQPCSASFLGHFATRRSGVVALQSLADSKAAFRILATGKILAFKGFHIPRTIVSEHMTAPEPRDRVWTADTEESEKSRAHVVWGSRERMIADEDMRQKMSEVLEDKLKLTCQKRKTDEPRRAVIILERMYFGNRAEFLEAYQRKKEEDIRNNIPRGMPTRFFQTKTGSTAVAN
ncbi:ribosome biogenesis protein BMS1 homolog isoform X1 [Papaver somniferum]|uniref:ribosome biogenesis protein BMS1 homolog isoform X1 n=1 Tax=Papaver somniferum TaxID=3469 RepID=UPI000E6FDD1B|nr:ribosome biogenesis protein BMS1 homolog isoform X1 [Papaver somniferum]